MNEILLDSNFSFRQAELKRQISEALNLDEEKRFSLLQGQWVHRYGLASLPNKQIFEDRNTGEAFIRNDELNSMMRPKHQKASDLEPEEESFELTGQSESVEDRKTLAHELLDALGNKFKEDKNELSMEDRVKSSSTDIFDAPPPPPRSLRHLRRWLPRVEDDDLPRAS